jgi:hypothetical protein
MKACSTHMAFAVTLLSMVMANTAMAQLAAPCVENSPEPRRGWLQHH